MPQMDLAILVVLALVFILLIVQRARYLTDICRQICNLVFGDLSLVQEVIYILNQTLRINQKTKQQKLKMNNNIIEGTISAK